MSTLDTPNFLTLPLAEQIRAEFCTPAYVYSESLLKEAAREVLAIPAPFGYTPRYAMKASSNRAILRLFDAMGLHVDASSGFEAERAMFAGISPEKIMLTAQELPKDLESLVKRGVFFNACSLHQLEVYGSQFPGTEVGLRINPGQGTGGHAFTNVGGAEAGFGIWHEAIPEVQKMLERHRLQVRTVHTHIGSGTDPEQWQAIAETSVKLLDRFPTAQRLSLGGGFKVARMPHEKTADLQAIGARIKKILETYAEETGRRIHLELEPGTFLVARAGTLLTAVQDLTHTSRYRFLKLDSGWTELMRPALYGAQHPIVVLNGAQEEEDYVVVGHCCESGDLFTPDPSGVELVAPRRMKKAAIGDLVAIEGVGAYAASMSALHYNSFPAAAELILRDNGALELIRKRETMEQMLVNEL